ncbi:uncharacterized protein LOC144632989 [Oculina patagonica]
MKPSYISVLHVAFVFFIGATLQLTQGSFDAAQRLEEVIEQAERESKILANEINQWLIQESGGLVKGDEQEHFRSRRPVDEDDEEERTDANLFSDVDRFIVRRDVGKDKESHKKTKDSSEIKRKDEKAGKETHHLLKKHGLDIQADKHRAKKGKTNKTAKDKAKDKKVSKAKRVSKKQVKKAKHKANSDELSKANLVKALIGGDAEAKAQQEQIGVPEKAYRELVEFMAGGEQPTIETTGSKKSDIAKPLSPAGTSHKGGLARNGKQNVRRTLTKKHKRVLSILSKMPQNVLRKYFHLKGLDKYWKVMDNIRRNQAAKQSVKEKLKAHKDEKIVKQLKDLAPKKAKTSSGLKHPEKIKLLQKQDKLHQKDSKQTVSQHKIVKDKAAKKIVKDETTKKTTKDKAIKETLKDKTTEKSQKPLALHSPSSQKVANVAKQTHPKKLQVTQNETAHVEKKEGHKTTVEQHAKEVVKPVKDMPKNQPKETKNKDFVGKTTKTSKVALHVKNSTSSSKTPEKTQSPGVKDASKQNVVKKVSLKQAATKQIALPKDSNVLHATHQPAQVGKVVKVNASQMKSPANPQSTKPAAKLQAVKIKDQIKIAKQKTQEDEESLQQQLKAMAPKLQHKAKNQNSSIVAHKQPKQIPKAPAVTEHHDVKTAHSPRQPEVKHDKTSQVKEQSPAPSKIDILKEKIQKTNNLKFKVAQALLAHCETQNRLRQVFEDVNSSLKKAASLAKAIGTKFGIKPSDIEKMTSEHTEGAVEQFLNKLF